MLKDHLPDMREKPPFTQNGLSNLKSALDLLPCAAAVWSVERTLWMLNARAKQLTGFVEADVDDASVWVRRISPRDRSVSTAAWSRLKGGASTSSCDYRFLPKGKRQEIWLRDVSVPYANTQNEMEGIISVYTDISEFKTGRTKDREKEEFASPAELVDWFAHEIQNSLQAISMGLDLLRLTQVDPIECQTVSRGIERASRFLREMREYFCPPEACFAAEDLEKELETVARRVEQEWARPDVQLDVICQKPPSRVRLDWLQFRNTCERLLTFSYALLSQGGKITLEAGLREIDTVQYVELCITTTSLVPLPVDEDEVFRMFLRVNGYQTGLSLELVRRMLRRQQGTITFRKEHAQKGRMTVLLREQPEPVGVAAPAVK